MVGAGRAGKKWVDLGSLAVWLSVAVAVNVLGSLVFTRFDLTEEQRHTLSQATKDQMRGLEDVVFVRIYLEGDLPTEFRALRDATRELLDAFRAYAGDNLQYEFINPSASPDEKERVKVYEELTRQGLQYTNIRMKAGDKMSEQIVFPGAIVSYMGRETPVQLLKSVASATEQEMIAASIQQLEYELVSAVRIVARGEKPAVAFITGQGELDELQTADAERALAQFYEVKRVEINQQVRALEGFKAVIIARPDSAFAEQDKFILDQFIMKGGRALWLIDPVFARMDSLRHSSTTLGAVLEHNLEDQLFKYGARLNADFILDLECIQKPIVTGFIGNQPRQEMFPWYYEPLLMGNNDHPISKNLDRIKTEFASTIEAIAVEGVTQTPLLQSSGKTRLQRAPVRISFNMLREPPKYEMFNTGPHTVAMLLEGEFPSVFKNRLPQKLTSDKGLDFREKSVPTKMIVVADGDIIANPVSRTEQKFYALGYDKYTKRTYANREFILNAVNFLCDDSGLLGLRDKDFKVRLLDQERIATSRYKWQILNTAVPVLMVLAFGLVFFYGRKKKYTI